MTDTMKFFTDGEAYERLMGRWSRRVGEIFLDWLDAPKGLHWLDVGCGNGAFSETIVARCAPAEVHGVDPADAQLAYARSRDASKGVQFHTGDAVALPFDNDRFDIAAMALVISFIPDPAKAAAEMKRVVRPGGLIANYMWDLPDGGVPSWPFRRAAKETGLAAPAMPPSAETARIENMQALWQGAGLEAVEARRIEIEISFTDFDDFWQSCTILPNPSVAYLRALSPDDVERVRTWLRENLPADASGRIRYGAVANAVKGRVPA